MIKHHPHASEIIDFAEGVLPSARSLLVSAHCDLCSHCRDKHDLYTESIASQIFTNDANYPTMSTDFVNMFENITSVDVDESAHSTPSAPQPLLNHKTVDINGKTFVLPSTLSRFVNRIGEWSHLLGKIWIAPVDLGEGELAQFIYMEEGSSVPEHTHKGNEWTLVIDGAFEDGIAEYGSGDYVLLDHSHTHTPVSKQGCLVFNIIDQPLYFTSGWAKFINPLSHLYFNANINSRS